MEIGLASFCEGGLLMHVAALMPGVEFVRKRQQVGLDQAAVEFGQRLEGGGIHPAGMEHDDICGRPGETDRSEQGPRTERVVAVGDERHESVARSHRGGGTEPSGLAKTRLMKRISAACPPDRG